METSTDIIGKAIRAIGSCENVLQVETAMRYARLAVYRKIKHQYANIDYDGYGCQGLEAHIRWIDYFETKKRDKEVSLAGFIRNASEPILNNTDTDQAPAQNRHLRIAPPKGATEILRSKQWSRARG